MKKEKRFSLLLPVVVCSILAITIYFQMTTGVISVRNTVNGKELPIYCVDTEEQVKTGRMGDQLGVELLIMKYTEKNSGH